MAAYSSAYALPAADRKPVDACAGYLVTYAPYLKYHTALAAGLPIASGIVEGACRSLVDDRMGLTGARWSLLGADAVLQLRASDDFDDYWVFVAGGIPFTQATPTGWGWPFSGAPARP
jgi:hypothetical protein